MNSMAQEKTADSSGRKTADDEKDFVPITLRIPKDVHARLKRVSQSEFRSLNHQIIMALSYFVEMQDRFGTLPHPDAVKKALPETAKGFPLWIKSAMPPSSSGRGSRS